MDSLFAAGAQPAGPGEFSRRAFLNGKLDLAQAEAVMDIISAEASAQADAAFQQLQGALSEQIALLSDKLYDLLAAVEICLDFEDEDLPVLESTAVSEAVSPIGQSRQATASPIGTYLANLSTRIASLESNVDQIRSTGVRTFFEVYVL